jgi:hypothetical protein
VSKLRLNHLAISLLNVIAVAAAIVLAYRAGFSNGAKSALYDRSNDQMASELDSLKSELKPLEAQLGQLGQEFGPLKELIEKSYGAGLLSSFGDSEPYVLMPSVASSDVIVLAHPNYPRELVELMAKHLIALYSGDKETVIATMQGENEWVLSRVKEKGSCQLRCVIFDSIGSADEESLKSQAYFYPVHAIYRDLNGGRYPVAEICLIGIANESGRFVVYDHD